MMNSHSAGSTVLLAAGVVLVFAGLSSALGFSLSGILASSAAIAALLYAGGVWFGGAPRPDPAVVLFTPGLLVASGPLQGRRVVDLHPAVMGAEIEARCREALAGTGSQFACASAAGHVRFSVTPVRDAAGSIVYGLLLSGSLATETRPVASAIGAAPAS